MANISYKVSNFGVDGFIAAQLGSTSPLISNAFLSRHLSVATILMWYLPVGPAARLMTRQWIKKKGSGCSTASSINSVIHIHALRRLRRSRSCPRWRLQSPVLSLRRIFLHLGEELYGCFGGQNLWRANAYKRQFLTTLFEKLSQANDSD